MNNRIELFHQLQSENKGSAAETAEGMTLGGKRAAFESQAEQQAGLRNKYRSFPQNLSPFGKTSAQDIMREEAELTDQLIESWRIQIAALAPDSTAQDIQKQAIENVLDHPALEPKSLSLMKWEESFNVILQQFKQALKSHRYDQADKVFRQKFDPHKIGDDGFSERMEDTQSPEFYIAFRHYEEIKLSLENHFIELLQNEDNFNFCKALDILSPIIKELRIDSFKNVEKCASQDTRQYLKKSLLDLLASDPSLYTEIIPLFEITRIFTMEGFASLHHTQEIIERDVLPALIKEAGQFLKQDLEPQLLLDHKEYLKKIKNLQKVKILPEELPSALLVCLTMFKHKVSLSKLSTPDSASQE